MARDYRADELSPGGIVYFSKNRRRYYNRRAASVDWRHRVPRKRGARWLGNVEERKKKRKKRGGWSGERRTAGVRMYGNWRFITAATSRPRFCSPQKLALLARVGDERGEGRRRERLTKIKTAKKESRAAILVARLVLFSSPRPVFTRPRDTARPSPSIPPRSPFPFPSPTS